MFCQGKCQLSVFLSTRLFYGRLHVICEHNLIKCCRGDDLLEGFLKGLRVRAAGLKLFIVSIDDLQCCLCIGGSLHLNSLTPKSVPARTKLVLFGRYVLNIYVGIVRYFLRTTKLSAPKSTYQHNAHIGEYRTIRF